MLVPCGIHLATNSSKGSIWRQAHEIFHADNKLKFHVKYLYTRQFEINKATMCFSGVISNNLNVVEICIVRIKRRDE